MRGVQGFNYALIDFLYKRRCGWFRALGAMVLIRVHKGYDHCVDVVSVTGIWLKNNADPHAISADWGSTE